MLLLLRRNVACEGLKMRSCKVYALVDLFLLARLNA